MLVGLLGANIMKSLSPPLFAAAFRSAGMDGYYHLMDVDQLPGRKLPDLFNAVRTAGFAMVNVTYPFKQDVMALIDTLDKSAAQVGSVNTVAFAPDGRTTGYNFDRAGFRRSFEEGLGRDRAEGKTVVMIGAGGAGRAVGFAMMDLGAILVIHDIDRKKAQGLADDIARHYGNARVRLAGDLEKEVAAADGVANATQLGMLGFPGNPVPVHVMKPTQWASDVIYTPIQTEFLRAAAAKGCRTLNGAGMCTYQAIEAFRMLTGIDLDPRVMHKAFADGLALRDADLAKSA
jgi:shikimate dehydrogenase